MGMDEWFYYSFALLARERSLIPHFIGVWVGTIANLDAEGKHQEDNDFGPNGK
jgi:hypothetical protein